MAAFHQHDFINVEDHLDIANLFKITVRLRFFNTYTILLVITFFQHLFQLQRFWELMSEKLIEEQSKPTTWVAALNSHGKITQFFIWNIAAEKEVICFHANIRKGFNMSIKDFQDESLRRLNSINIVPLIVVQDGFGFLPTSALPLMHSSCHLFAVLKNMEIIAMANIVTVFDQSVFTQALELSGLYKLVENNLSWNHSLLRDRFDRSIFNAKNEQTLINWIGIICGGQFHALAGNMTQIVSCFFHLFRTWWEREQLLTDDEKFNNSRILLAVSIMFCPNTNVIFYDLFPKAMESALEYLDSPRFFFLLSPFKRRSAQTFIQSMKNWHRVLQANRNISFEAFTLAFEYELACASKGHFYRQLPSRLAEGEIYTAPRLLENFAGKTQKTVSYPALRMNPNDSLLFKNSLLLTA